jgi:ubiquitin carboxyl-terminal hydrolase 25/28
VQVADFPGKADHYKMCLGIIASAQGEERPGLQNFIQTGSRGKGDTLMTRPVTDLSSGGSTP